MTNIEQKVMATVTTPPTFPETTPPAYPSSDYSFTLQAIMEMQKTLGQLTQAVTTLTEESKKHREKIDDMSHKIYAAKISLWIVGFVLTAVGGIVAFFLNRIWEIIPLIPTKPHP